MKTVGIPLVLTFQLDPVSQERLDAWRAQYFPKERNYLKAHLTIYHQLPGQEIAAITEILSKFAGEHSSFPIRFASLMTRQGFVGVKVVSETLEAMRAELSGHFASVLRAQDKKPFKAHVTITNLGSPRDALHCYAEMEKVFASWDGLICGLNLYHYRNGPWEFANSFPFAAPSEV